MICLLALAACARSDASEPGDGAAKPAVPAAEVLLPRDDLPGLPNFARVSDALFRGAQPTAEGMEHLRELGVRTVVNLRSAHSDRDELRGLGFRCAHIHCKSWHPEKEDILRFLSIVSDPANQPVFVHCQHGADRTGMMVAAYRIAVEGWSPEAALEELPRFGFHPIWTGIRAEVLGMDGEELRRGAAALPREDLAIVR